MCPVPIAYVCELMAFFLNCEHIERVIALLFVELLFSSTIYVWYPLQWFGCIRFWLFIISYKLPFIAQLLLFYDRLVYALKTLLTTHNH